MLVITGLYVSILAILILFLAFKVVKFRRVNRIGVGDNGDNEGLRVIRVHANAVEYVPMMVVLMAVYEINGGSSMVLHTIGVIAVIARILHAFGLSMSEGKSFGRFHGTLLTWLITLVLSVLNIYHFILN